MTSFLDSILDDGVFIERQETILLKRYAVDSKNVKNLIQLANLFRKKGNIEQSLDYCSQIIKIESEHPEAKQLIHVLRAENKLNNQDSDKITPSPFYLVSNFLSKENLAKIEAIIEQNNAFFRSSKVNSKELDVEDTLKRKSKILHKKYFLEFSELLENQLIAKLPDVLAKLNMDLPEIKKPELFLTMHLDGDFFKVHMDVLSSGPGSLRALTYVFYYHKNPKGFDGGDLLLFDTSADGKQYSMDYTKICPVRNSIVFFPSRSYHKVTPIQLKTDDYLNGRFTLNGWFHR